MLKGIAWMFAILGSATMSATFSWRSWRFNAYCYYLYIGTTFFIYIGHQLFLTVLEVCLRYCTISSRYCWFTKSFEYLLAINDVELVNIGFNSVLCYWFASFSYVDHLDDYLQCHICIGSFLSFANISLRLSRFRFSSRYLYSSTSFWFSTLSSILSIYWDYYFFGLRWA